VPVHFINEDKCEAFRQGGSLEVVRHAVEISVRADHIPEELVVDLAGHKMGDTIRFSDLKVPAGVEPTISDRDFVIASIKVSSAAQAAAADEAADAEAAEAAAEAEVPATEQAEEAEAAAEGETSEG
jgi:large subunit ribosomal protein L25